MQIPWKISFQIFQTFGCTLMIDDVVFQIVNQFKWKFLYFDENILICMRAIKFALQKRAKKIAIVGISIKKTSKCVHVHCPLSHSRDESHELQNNEWKTESTAPQWWWYAEAECAFYQDQTMNVQLIFTYIMNRIHVNIHFEPKNGTKERKTKHSPQITTTRA